MTTLFVCPAHVTRW